LVAPFHAGDVDARLRPCQRKNRLSVGAIVGKFGLWPVPLCF
jgi:hypothetical protein